MTTQDAVSEAQREPDELQRGLDATKDLPLWDAFDACQSITADAIAALRRLQAAQREPVAEAARLRVIDLQDIYAAWRSGERPEDYPALCLKIESALRQAQRDDHPTEGLLREARAMLNDWLYGDEGAFTMQQHIDFLAKLDAALAASKDKPDLERPRSRETAAESLSVDTSVAIPLDLARFLLGEADHRGRWFGETYAGVPRYWWRTPLRNAIDAAMSADVRSQAKEKP